ncbi:MAG: metal ABC transporter permease [Paramuribaculum sp.]|nr:metal ABC transporter permease [Paramuribaculum sp.]
MLELIDYDFFRNALIGVAVISIASAVIGTYIVTRRLAAICGGVTHACFGGLGLGYFLGINPVIMASVFAIGASAGVEWLSTRHRIRHDSAIAMVWALGMALGIIFVFMTPGYVPELTGFLFGNVLTISMTDIVAFVVFTAVLLVFVAVYYRQIVMCAFDPDFSRVVHVNVRFITYSMTVLTAICIVLTIRLVGVMLLMSMLVLPQIIAEIYCRRFRSIMLWSIVISLTGSVGGLLLSAASDVPCSAVMVLVLLGIYVIVKSVSGFTSGCRGNKLTT